MNLAFLPQWTLRRILAVQVVDRYAARDRGALQPFGIRETLRRSTPKYQKP
jgi:hypothetical protein